MFSLATIRPRGTYNPLIFGQGIGEQMTQKVIEAVVAGLAGYAISYLAIGMYSSGLLKPENEEYELRMKREEDELRMKRRICLQLAAWSAFIWILFHLTIPGDPWD